MHRPTEQYGVPMTTGPTDARPKQVRVADALRELIETGELPPGAKLMTLDELAATYKCSVTVARKAVDLLKQQGLVVTQQGLGTFVRMYPQARRHGIERYSRRRWQHSGGDALLTGEATDQGHTVVQQIREFGEVPAPNFVARAFDIPVGTPVWVRRHTTMMDERPSQLADSYYELDAVAGTLIMDAAPGPGGGFACLEDAGYRLTEIEESVGARMPTGPESAALDLPAGTPVLDLMRVTFTDSGQAVEVMKAVVAGDTATFAYRFPIPD